MFYRLRARATDRAGNPVTASLDLFVSGEEDEIKLRLFTERTGYEAGETAKITIHSRVEQPNLVLVTYEAEGVLGHRLIVPETVVEQRPHVRFEPTVPVPVVAALLDHLLYLVGLLAERHAHRHAAQEPRAPFSISHYHARPLSACIAACNDRNLYRQTGASRRDRLCRSCSILSFLIP